MTSENYHYRVLYVNHTEEPLALPPEAEPVEVLHYIPQSRLIRLLVREPLEAAARREALADSAGVPTEFSEESEPTCAGKDGECSRTVDQPGNYCWQHDEEGDR